MDAQRSQGWFEQRIGRITASRMCDVMAFTKDAGVPYKSGPKKGQPRPLLPLQARTDYIRQLATERITGNAKRQVSAAALEWGKEWEPTARREYENRTGLLTEQAFFILHPTFPFIGASPDHFVNPDGGGEIKCPFDEEVHLTTLEDGLPDEHKEQIQGGLWVTGRKWWDFVSFHPNFPDHLRLYVERVDRDDAYIAKLADACISLNDEVQAIVKKHLEKAA